MDHILENNDNPVPDPSAISHSDPPKPSIDEDDEEEEDAAALRAAIGLSTGATPQAGGSAVSTSGEAKVCVDIFVHSSTMLLNYGSTSKG